MYLQGGMRASMGGVTEGEGGANGVSGRRRGDAGGGK